MSVARNLVILGVWATGMGAFVWWKYLRIEDSLNVPGEASSTSVASNSAADAANTKDWKWQSESHWVVDQITRDITEMSLFALNANSDLNDPKVLELSVTPTPGTHHGQTYVVTAKAPKGPLSVSLPLQKHLWAVENYLVWRDGLRRAWSPTAASKDKLPAGEQKELEELVQRLTTPTTETVVKESQKISQALTKNPQSPELHEAAALLIGTQALREAAGHFSDVRPSLSRITAHLVMARSVQPEPGTHGRLAEVILLTLEVRQQEALDKLESLPAGLDAWQRALRMRNTGDWRVLQDLTDTTLLEKIEHARALTASLDTGAMVRKYEGELTGPLPDWSRLGTERNFSVEEGHRLTNHWMEKELGELASAWKAWSGKELNADSLVVVLNDPATRAVVKGDNKRRQIEVLSWGSLAAGHQRHLCHAIGRTQLFLQDKWGVDDAAAGFENQVLQNFAGLRLLPFVQKRTARQPKTQAAAMEAASDLCRKHPEWVTSCNWFAVGQKSRSANAAANKTVSYPRAPAWFTVEVPWGTAYDFDSRYHDLGTLYRANQTRWDELIAIAPYSYDVIRTHRHKTYGTPASLEQMQKSFAPVLEYHLRAMEETADRLKEDPKAYLAAMTRVCQLDPDKFVKLGEYLVESGLKEDAAFAYQAAFELARDRVYWSNHAGWLVDYCYEKGRTEDALKMAQAAAEVYSYRGLETMADLLEKLERWEESMKHFQAIAERYQDAAPLLAFLSRNHEKSPELATAFDTATKATFPDGMHKVTLNEFSDAPESGVAFTSNSGALQRSGLRKGEIVVALDGYRVDDMDQYQFVRAFKEEAPLVLIVWDGSSYREVTANVTERRFGCEMESYLK